MMNVELLNHCYLLSREDKMEKIAENGEYEELVDMSISPYLKIGN